MQYFPLRGRFREVSRHREAGTTNLVLLLVFPESGYKGLDAHYSLDSVDLTSIRLRISHKPNARADKQKRRRTKS